MFAARDQAGEAPAEEDLPKMGRKLFIGNLAFETTGEELKEMFGAAGACESASVVMDRMTGQSRGFGFVEMASDEDARRAVGELDGRELRGRALRVSEARERGSRPPAFGSHGGGGFGGGDSFSGPPGAKGNRPRKEGGSRRRLRARKRSL